MENVDARRLATETVLTYTQAEWLLHTLTVEQILAYYRCGHAHMPWIMYIVLVKKGILDPTREMDHEK